MPAQSLVYTPGPSSAPLGPLSIIIIPCKCCQRSVWYKLGIMGDQTPKVKERRRKEKRKIQKLREFGWCGMNPGNSPGVKTSITPTPDGGQIKLMLLTFTPKSISGRSSACRPPSVRPSP